MLNIYFRVMKQKQMNFRLWAWTGLYFFVFFVHGWLSIFSLRSFTFFWFCLVVSVASFCLVFSEDFFTPAIAFSFVRRAKSPCFRTNFSFQRRKTTPNRACTVLGTKMSYIYFAMLTSFPLECLLQRMRKDDLSCLFDMIAFSEILKQL